MTSPDLPRTPLPTTRDDYSESYYHSALGPPYESSEPHWSRFFGAVAIQLLRHLPIKTALDAGCAKGFLVEALLHQGVDAYGVDISEHAIAEASEEIRDRVWVHDLSQPLAGKWDLVTCIEVIEHMAPAEAQQAIDNITTVTDLVLLSSTPHDFGEATHVNVHPPADWAEWFAARGFYRRTDVDVSGLSPWAVVFERRQLTTPAVVHLYEAELAPLREEVIVKRNALLEANRRVDQQATAERGTEEARPWRSDLASTPDASELASLDRILALTDQVIGLQCELAEARYHHDMAELELASAEGSLPSPYGMEGDNLDAVMRARLISEIELRQGLVRQLHEERNRADEADRQLRAIRSSRWWQMGHVARSVARTVRKVWT